MSNPQSYQPLSAGEKRFVRNIGNLVALAALAIVLGALVSLSTIIAGGELSILNIGFLVLGAPAAWLVFSHVKAMIKR